MLVHIEGVLGPFGEALASRTVIREVEQVAVYANIVHHRATHNKEVPDGVVGQPAYLLVANIEGNASGVQYPAPNKVEEAHRLG